MDKKSRKVLDKKLHSLGWDFIALQLADDDLGKVFFATRNNQPSLIEKVVFSNSSRAVKKQHSKSLKLLTKQFKTEAGLKALEEFLKDNTELVDKPQTFNDKLDAAQKTSENALTFQYANMICEILKASKNVDETKQIMNEFNEILEEAMEERGIGIGYRSIIPGLIDDMSKVLQADGIEIQTTSEAEAN